MQPATLAIIMPDGRMWAAALYPDVVAWLERAAAERTIREGGIPAWNPAEQLADYATCIAFGFPIGGAESTQMIPPALESS
jgi:hypothetical protein